MATSSLVQAEERLPIIIDVLTEIRDELQKPWDTAKKRKIVPAEEFYSNEYPNEYHPERPKK